MAIYIVGDIDTAWYVLGDPCVDGWKLAEHGLGSFFVSAQALHDTRDVPGPNRPVSWPGLLPELAKLR